MTIAVFVDGEQHPRAPHEAERVALFHKHGGAWIETESRPVWATDNQSYTQIAALLHSLAALTQGAQAVAGSVIAGRAFAVLNQQGKHIFEISDITQEQLSGIAEDIAMEDARKKLAEDAFKVTRPTETDIAGVYTLDLVTALEEYPELSSKMILKPFLKSTPFMELTLICRHIPHWLETEREITVQKKQRGDYLVLTIQKQCCEEAIL
ncbi:MAG TPA: Fe-only nitrogenase accessory AnfO family protein [Candidatus Limiplasma sp.]|mgnify:CR=1 FL=1|nr:Fe-only nitrogenase accessory AnfO family protein [Candidatus Limiplasma sp.]